MFGRRGGRHRRCAGVSGSSEGLLQDGPSKSDGGDFGMLDDGGLLGDEEELLLEEVELSFVRLDVALDCALSIVPGSSHSQLTSRREQGRRDARLEVARRCDLLPCERAEELRHNLVRRIVVARLQLAVVLALDRLLVEVELELHHLLLDELDDEVRVTRLALTDRGVDVDLRASRA